MAAFLILYSLPLLMVAGAVSDLARYRIPNGISLTLVAAFVVAGPLSGLGWAQMAEHGAIGFAALVFGFALFRFGYIGGGDAKLFAAGALWFGLDGLGTYAFGISLSGGVLCAIVLAYRAIPLPFPTRPWLRALHDRANGVPYGVAIASGAILALPMSDWMALAFAA